MRELKGAAIVHAGFPPSDLCDKEDYPGQPTEQAREWKYGKIPYL